MIKANKSYKVYDVRKGKTNNSHYTIVKIKESIPKGDGSFLSEYYSVYANDDIDVYVNANIIFTIIDGVRKKTTNYNGKFYNECTLFVSPENFRVETLGDAPSGGDKPASESDLPF